jgi:thioredoxin-related protein
MNKTIALLLALFLFVINVQASTLTEGVKKAKKEDKGIILYFFSKDCMYCAAMEKDVINEKEINKKLKSEVIYIPIDIEKNREETRQYGVKAYPTTILMETTGQRIASIPGYIGKEEFRKILTYMKGKHYKMMGLGDFIQASKGR